MTLDGPSSMQIASKNSLKYTGHKYMVLAHQIRYRGTIKYYGPKYKMKLDKFVQSSLHHHGGFKVLDYSLVVSSRILAGPPSPCTLLIQCLAFPSMLGPFFTNINTFDLGSIIFSCILGKF
jgi:hypothetical protein